MTSVMYSSATLSGLSWDAWFSALRNAEVPVPKTAVSGLPDSAASDRAATAAWNGWVRRKSDTHGWADALPEQVREHLVSVQVQRLPHPEPVGVPGDD